jgi:TRAP-type mannitol/chloroaromatic compound transport system substrate-binding protein
MALGLHKAAKYYYYPGFHEPGAAVSLAVNKKLSDCLGSTEKSIIEGAAAIENTRSLAESTADGLQVTRYARETSAVRPRRALSHFREVDRQFEFDRDRDCNLGIALPDWHASPD